MLSEGHMCVFILIVDTQIVVEFHDIIPGRKLH